MTPYFCIYTGNVLVGKMKEALRDGTGTKNELISDYCSAMETKAFGARKSLMDKTLHGKPCIDSYKEVYNNALV